MYSPFGCQMTQAALLPLVKVTSNGGNIIAALFSIDTSFRRRVRQPSFWAPSKGATSLRPCQQSQATVDGLFMARPGSAPGGFGAPSPLPSCWFNCAFPFGPPRELILMWFIDVQM